MDSQDFFAPAGDGDYAALMQAVVDDDQLRLDGLLDTGLDVGALYGKDGEGCTVLHEAAARGHIGIIQRLLARGAQVDVRDRDRDGLSTPLFYAAGGGHVEAAQVLIDAGADVNAYALDYGSVLLSVLRLARPKHRPRPRYMEMIRLLLDRGADIHAAFSYGEGPILLQATVIGDLQLMKMLLGLGATLDFGPITPLRVAVEWHETPEVVRYLLELGARDEPDDERGLSAFRSAAIKGKVRILDCLLTHADAATRAGNTQAVGAAARAGQVEAVEFLLGRGFAADTMDDWGHTPLHHACETRPPRPALVDLLLAHGVDVNVRTKLGNTPLHLSARWSDPTTVQSLLRAGASLTARNDAGETALIRFANRLSLPEGESRPRTQSFRLVLEAGSNVEAKDAQMRTALHALVADTSNRPVKSALMAAKLLVGRGLDAAARDAQGKTAAEYIGASDDEELRRWFVGPS
ncbi:MAG: hypothetical protein M1832_000275 [Thelocarpon impressellum]|nr:MAG: hypothetical protein M1832_000275 [Thelocarpon impressellum]